jgi:integrase
MTAKNLSDRTVQKIVAKAKRLTAGKRIRVGDGDGLWLQAGPSGASWLYRYKPPGRRNSRAMGLGPWPIIGLEAARKKRDEQRLVYLSGKDPKVQRQAARAAQLVELAKRKTFAQAMAEYLKEFKETWTTQHFQQWENSLNTYAVPILGGLYIADITAGHVRACVQPHWHDKVITMSRVAERIILILNRADHPKPITTEQLKLPTAARLLKHKPKRHFAALPYAAVPKLMAKLRQRGGPRALAVEFLILTASRVGEVRGLTWEQIDGNRWTCLRRGGKREYDHVIPLAPRAMQILKTMKPDITNSKALVFPKVPVNGLLELIRSLAYAKDEASIHGFRSSFSDWCDETTNAKPAVRDMALSHKVHSEVVAAYSRSELLDLRQKLANDWADYCGSAPVSKVVKLRT